MNGEEVAGVVGAHERRDVKTSVLWGVPLPTPTASYTFRIEDENN